MSPPSVPRTVRFAYAAGQLGRSILFNLIGVQLVFFYLPPETANIPERITTTEFLGILNAITLIAASGRLLDAVTDPIIAGASDRSTHRWGRRIPFMAVGALPSAVLLFLMFFPPASGASTVNIVWLVVAQALYYVATTMFQTPHFALLPELAHTPEERLQFATVMAVGFAFGIILVGLSPVIGDVAQDLFDLTESGSVQASVGVLAVIAAILMYVTVFGVDERRYSDATPSSEPVRDALLQTMMNPNMRWLIIADFTYFLGLQIVVTGLLFYVTVLLEQKDTLVAALLPVMIGGSLLLYPLVNLLARRLGKKTVVVLALLVLGAAFLFVAALGLGPIPPLVQAYLLALAVTFPLAAMTILPNAILADIATLDALERGDQREGMFFAAKTLSEKFGQTGGVLLFAMMATLGRDIGDDLGIRLSGLVGCVLCIGAGLLFVRYDEAKVLSSSEHLRV